MDYKIASVATQWWIDQMTKRCKELYPDKVSGNDSNLEIIDSSLKREFSRFQELLYKELLHHISFHSYLSLTCYYWPSGDLGVIARKTSISRDYFPLRANMQVFDGSVEVSLNGEDLRKLPLPTE